MSRLLNIILKKIPPEEIFTLVDVGAMGGLQAEWKDIGDEIRTVGFEPDEREFSKLSSSPNRLYLNVALSEKSEQLKFYVLYKPGTSSVYRPNFKLLREFPKVERFEIISEVVIPASKVDSLDSALRKHEILDVDFLKLDTQGSELPILAGSQDYLRNSILGLKVEVEFLELYEGQPLFAELDAYLREQGFQLMDLRRMYWKRNDYTHFVGKGQLVFGDALYLKKHDYFFELLKNSDMRYAQNKTVKFAAACLVYGMRDYAVFLLNQARRHGYITENVWIELTETIRNEDRSLRNWYFSGYLSFKSFLRAIRKMLSRSSQNWADGDRFLGNPYTLR